MRRKRSKREEKPKRKTMKQLTKDHEKNFPEETLKEESSPDALEELLRKAMMPVSPKAKPRKKA